MVTSVPIVTANASHQYEHQYDCSCIQNARNLIPTRVFTLQSANKTIFHAVFFPATWQKKITNSESKISSFPRCRHSGPLANVPVMRSTRYRHNHVTGTHFRCHQECARNEYLLYPGFEAARPGGRLRMYTVETDNRLQPPVVTDIRFEEKTTSTESDERGQGRLSVLICTRQTVGASRNRPFSDASEAPENRLLSMPFLSAEV